MKKGWKATKSKPTTKKGYLPALDDMPEMKPTVHLSDKGYSKKPKKVHDMVKKGYTKAHIANSKDPKKKGDKAWAQIGQQNNDNNAQTMEGLT